MKKLTSLLVCVGLLVLAIIGFASALSPTQIAADSAANKVSAHFRTAWIFESPEDTFVNSEVIGRKWWQVDMMNSPDETGASVTALTLRLESTLAFDILKIENLVTSGPPTYEWSFGDVPEQSGADVWVDSLHDSNSVPVTFSPGFDASRSVDKSTFSETDTQSLTITLTPREMTEGFTVLIYAEENDIVNPVITSPASGDGIYLAPDGHSLNIDPVGLELNTTWTVDVTIQVIPKVPEATFMPYVLIGQRGMVASGSDSGNSLSYPVGDPSDGVGDWTWRAGGLYEWEWNESLSKRVIWMHSFGAVGGVSEGAISTPEDMSVLDEDGNHVSVYFLSNWMYGIEEDDFTNAEVMGQKIWRIAALVNTPDKTGAPINGVKVTFESDLTFDFVKVDPLPSRPGSLTRMGPPVYEWSFGDVPEGLPEQTGVVYDAIVGFTQPTTKATPGYDVSRSFDKTMFTGPGSQTMTVIVTPREEWVKKVNVSVSTWEDDFVDPVFVSISSGDNAGFARVDLGGRTAEVLNIPAQINIPITVIVKSQITPRVPIIEYKPNVNVHVDQPIIPQSGTSRGNSFSYTNEVGVWTVSAEGEYVWRWQASIPSTDIVASKYEVTMHRTVAVPESTISHEPANSVDKEGGEFPVWVGALIGGVVIVGLAAYFLIKTRRKRASL